MDAAASQALEEGAGGAGGALGLAQFRELLLRGEAQLDLYDVRAAAGEQAPEGGARAGPRGVRAAGRGAAGRAACCAVS